MKPYGSFTLAEIEPETDTMKVPIDLKDTVSILARNGLPTHFHKLLQLSKSQSRSVLVLVDLYLTLGLISHSAGV